MIGLPRKHPFLVASLAFLVLCFAVYWLFVDKLETRTYQDHVTIDGKGPWEGSLGPPFDQRAHSTSSSTGLLNSHLLHLDLESTDPQRV
jgi:hypothetical protein